jgi:hypothetical protein
MKIIQTFGIICRPDSKKYLTPPAQSDYVYYHALFCSFHNTKTNNYQARNLFLKFAFLKQKQKNRLHHAPKKKPIYDAITYHQSQIMMGINHYSFGESTYNWKKLVEWSHSRAELCTEVGNSDRDLHIPTPFNAHL